MFVSYIIQPLSARGKRNVPQQVWHLARRPAKARGRPCHFGPLPFGTLALRIAFASDHAAVALKALLVAHAEALGHTVVDLGPDSEARVDYPDFGYKLARAIAAGEAERGVALCGSGIGISIAVNREPACRCALVGEPLSAMLARQHNDANVLAMGARLIGPDLAKACLEAFLATPFEGGRHQHRVDKLARKD
ncbi:Sugar-phosphate isomerase [Sphingomonas sp. RIT328]|nr:Sugar-phosphate isomerase [Sphingomonas sp. RIT328]